MLFEVWHSQPRATDHLSPQVQSDPVPRFRRTQIVVNQYACAADILAKLGGILSKKVDIMSRGAKHQSRCMITYQLVAGVTLIL